MSGCMYVFLSTNDNHQDCHWVNEYYSLSIARWNREELTRQGANCGPITRVPLPKKLARKGKAK